MVDIIRKYNLNSLIKYEFFKTNNAIQDIICKHLFLIELLEKSKDKSKRILMKIRRNIIKNNKTLIYDYNYRIECDVFKMNNYYNKITVQTYFMFCSIYEINDIKTLFENDFIKYQIDQIMEESDIHTNIQFNTDRDNRFNYSLFLNNFRKLSKVNGNRDLLFIVDHYYRNMYSNFIIFDIENEDIFLSLYHNNFDNDDDFECLFER